MIEGILVLFLSLIWIMNFEFYNFIYCLIGIGIGLILFICGIISLYLVFRETQEDLITEILSSIRIVPTGFHNKARKLEGVVNEEKRSFILRGKDISITRIIKETNPNNIVIVYHSSNNRIESITIQ